MHDQLELTEGRIRRLLNSRIQPGAVRARHLLSTAASTTTARHLDREAVLALSSSPLEVGAAWGPPWSTTWLTISGTVPEAWEDAEVELVVDLGFGPGGPGFSAEGLLFSGDFQILKGIAPRNHALSLGRAKPATPLCFYLEAAANPAIRPTEPDGSPLGDPETAGDAPLFRYRGAELVAIDLEVRALALDVEVLLEVAGLLAVTDQRRADLIAALERALDLLDPSDVAPGATAARAALAPVLAEGAAPFAHRLSAVGHAHIDSAWLWPLEETVRKCGRTVANVLELMDRYPDFTFVCSQAQQYLWLKEHYPTLYSRVKARAEEGRYIPVGGMWVETDTNLPGGESLVRQLLYGKRFFLEEFGIECREIWLPDCFGFTGSLPQIARLAGCDRFVSQKLSWNETNRFPHHTFIWEGIDGSRLFTHFPPVDTYNADLSPAELMHAASNFADKLGARRSLVPFGYGDGGGGPTREMLERAARLGDLAGMPRLVLEPLEAFFSAAIAEYEEPPVWSGELPLELHRGTFSSQAEIKRQLRLVEHRLRAAETWWASAAVLAGAPYPYEELEEAWKTLCLRQFHDIAPGSSIAAVNREAIQTLAALGQRLFASAADAVTALCGEGAQERVANTAPVALDGLAPLAVVPRELPAGAVSVNEEAGAFVLDNGLLRAVVDGEGALVSLVDLEEDERELVAPGQRAFVLQLHPDLPRAWDAWDLDRAYRRSAEDLCGPVQAEVARDDEGVALRWRREFRASAAIQQLRLAPGARRLELSVEVDWHERDHCLKLAFPLDLATSAEVAEIQFGHVRRPTHENTSWDVAHFERCAQRFVHLPEGDYGVTLANDATFGYDVARLPRPGGGFTTTLRPTLLRGPRYPDPGADAGTHRFAFALAPGGQLRRAIAEGYRLNLPPIPCRVQRDAPPILTNANPAVVIEAIKLAEDRSGDLIVRCYEAEGARATTTLRAARAIACAARVDLLERPLAQLALDGEAELGLSLRPFEIVTLRLTLA